MLTRYFYCGPDESFLQLAFGDKCSSARLATFGSLPGIPWEWQMNTIPRERWRVNVNILRHVFPVHALTDPHILDRRVGVNS